MNVLIVLAFLCISAASATEDDKMPPLPNENYNLEILPHKHSDPKEIYENRPKEPTQGVNANEPDFAGITQTPNSLSFTPVGRGDQESGDEENETSELVEERAQARRDVEVDSDEQKLKLEKVEDFIFKGDKARKFVFPYMASIQVYYYGRWYHVCGGSLIASDKVLTAAHCMIYRYWLRYRVGLGYHNLHTDEHQPFVQNIGVKYIKIHEHFNLYSTYSNDIAILTLESCARFNKFVQPIPVAPKNLYISYYYTCVFTGWGRTEKGYTHVLQQRYTRIVSRNTCKKFWSVNPYVKVRNTNICELDWPRSSSGCSGDSGGPLVCRGYLVGLFSWGLNICNGCLPGVHTKVGLYNKWIDANW